MRAASVTAVSAGDGTSVATPMPVRSPLSTTAQFSASLRATSWATCDWLSCRNFFITLPVSIETGQFSRHSESAAHVSTAS